MTAHNFRDVVVAIGARIVASTGASYSQGTFHQRAPGSISPQVGAKPYTTFYVQADFDDTFTTNGFRINGTIEITDHRDNGHENLWTLMHRIVGDSVPPDTAPTYGLHRHPLTLSGDNKAGWVVFTGITPSFQDSGDAIGWILTFTVTETQGVAS